LKVLGELGQSIRGKVEEPVILGIDFGGSKIAFAVADLAGARLGSSVVLTDPERGARWNLDHGISTGQALLEAVARGRSVGAVGACTFGIPRTHGIRLAPAIPGWSELSLGLELEAAFGTRLVRVVTDVKAAAGAEARSGALAGYDPAIYVNLGTGLAIGIISGGKVVLGANGAAGEIGYSLRQPRDIDAARGDRLVLEEVVSGMAIAAVGVRRTDEGLSAAQVFASEPDDPRLAGALDDFIRELSFHLVNIAVALDPARIAVGGGMVRSWPRLAGPIKAALDDNVPFPPDLVVGKYPFDAALVGALDLAAEAARREPPGQQRDTSSSNGLRRGREASPSTISETKTGRNAGGG
jgi:glucokinase